MKETVAATVQYEREQALALDDRYKDEFRARIKEDEDEVEKMRAYTRGEISKAEVEIKATSSRAKEAIKNMKAEMGLAEKEIKSVTRILVSQVWRQIGAAARGLLNLTGLNKTVAGKIAGTVISTISMMISTAYRVAFLSGLENNWLAVAGAINLAIQLPLDIMQITQSIVGIMNDTSIESALTSLGGSQY